MDKTRFSQIVDAYGAEPRRWPAAEREAATAFARTDRTAAAALAEARVLERWLDASVTVEPSAATRRGVLDRAPRPRSRFGGMLGWWAPGAGLAAAAVAGVVLGSGLLGPDPRIETLLAEAEAYDVTALLDAGGEEAL